MSLSPGTRIGVYEITGLLGAGGMGEVYRAKDSKLKREVALKVLPADVANDRERMARFQREAEVLASLNHPNIAQIYGIEESRSGGSSDPPINALVMELVEGEDLAERLKRGAIPIDEALPIARQIAEALEAAHEQGIIHRDLKPANIKVRPDGTVKVLDFGLAKALDRSEGDGSSRRQAEAEASALQTITSPAMTMRGMILGTAAYMAPEQARGLPVDKRADIWAFGCVLFEMLTGTPPFTGATVTDLLAAVVSVEPDWSRLSSSVPPDVRTLIERCLTKDARRRLRDIGDAEFDLHRRVAPLLAAPGTPRVWWGMAAAVAAAVAGGILAGSAFSSGRAIDDSGRVSQLAVLMPPGQELFTLSGNPLSISADGSRLSFVAVGGGNRQVFVRPMDATDAVALRGTDAAVHSFFSPDGTMLGLVSRDRTLKRLSLADELLSDVGSTAGAGFNRPVWGRDGHITYALKGLWRVPFTGDTPMALTSLDAARGEGLHIPTAVLADGTVIFTNWDQRGISRIEAVRPSDGHRVVLVDRASSGLVSPTGHLLFVRNGAILAAPFDAAKLRVTGEAVQVIPRDVVRFNSAQPVIALADNGTLAYAGAKTGLARLVRVSATGVVTPISEAGRHYGHPRVSPDGQRIVVENAGESLWIHDMSRESRASVTSGPLPGVTFPIWLPDGRRIVYRRLDELWTIDAAGSGKEQPIAGSLTGDIPTAASPDGDTLVVLRTSGGSGGDLYALSMSGARPARPIVVTPGYDGGADFSPDGKLMVYASTDSGPSQIYLMPFPEADRKWSVSTRGGTQARFSRSGKQVFYRDESRMMVVDVETTGSQVRLSPPRELFTSTFNAGALVTVANYDVTPNGDFVMMQTEPGTPYISVILNWTTLLRRTLAQPLRP